MASLHTSGVYGIGMGVKSPDDLQLFLDHDHLSLSARVFRVLREATAMSVRVFLHEAAPEALNLIRSIVSSHPTPLKTQDLYNLALKQPVDGTVNHILRPDKADPKDGPLPPHPNHPIRSLR